MKVNIIIYEKDRIFFDSANIPEDISEEQLTQLKGMTNVYIIEDYELVGDYDVRGHWRHLQSGKKVWVRKHERGGNITKPEIDQSTIGKIRDYFLESGYHDQAGDNLEQLLQLPEGILDMLVKEGFFTKYDDTRMRGLKTYYNPTEKLLKFEYDKDPLNGLSDVEKKLFYEIKERLSYFENKDYYEMKMDELEKYVYNWIEDHERELSNLRNQIYKVTNPSLFHYNLKDLEERFSLLHKKIEQVIYEKSPSLKKILLLKDKKKLLMKEFNTINTERARGIYNEMEKLEEIIATLTPMRRKSIQREIEAKQDRIKWYNIDIGEYEKILNEAKQELKEYEQNFEEATSENDKMHFSSLIDRRIDDIRRYDISIKSREQELKNTKEALKQAKKEQAKREAFDLENYYTHKELKQKLGRTIPSNMYVSREIDLNEYRYVDNIEQIVKTFKNIPKTLRTSVSDLHVYRTVFDGDFDSDDKNVSGVFFGSTNDVYIGMKSWNNRYESWGTYTKKWMREVTIHECAHALHLTGNMDGEELMTIEYLYTNNLTLLQKRKEYGAKNVREFFAEAYTNLYMKRTSWFKGMTPDVLPFIKEMRLKYDFFGEFEQEDEIVEDMKKNGIKFSYTDENGNHIFGIARVPEDMTQTEAEQLVSEYKAKWVNMDAYFSTSKDMSEDYKVEGHWRVSKTGKKHWVKTHERGDKTVGKEEVKEERKKEHKMNREELTSKLRSIAPLETLEFVIKREEEYIKHLEKENERIEKELKEGKRQTRWELEDNKGLIEYKKKELEEDKKLKSEKERLIKLFFYTPEQLKEKDSYWLFNEIPKNLIISNDVDINGVVQKLNIRSIDMGLKSIPEKFRSVAPIRIFNKVTDDPDSWVDKEEVPKAYKDVGWERKNEDVQAQYSPIQNQIRINATIDTITESLYHEIGHAVEQKLLTREESREFTIIWNNRNKELEEMGDLGKYQANQMSEFFAVHFAMAYMGQIDKMPFEETKEFFIKLDKKWSK